MNADDSVFLGHTYDRATVILALTRFLQILFCAACAWVGSVIIFGYAVYCYPRQVLTVDTGDVKADALVVLGGGQDERPQRAAELFRQGAAPRILVSGHGDCAANVELLELNGVPPDAIAQEGDSLSTFENAKYSIPILRKMGANRVIIVTSWFHSRRALVTFEHLAPDIHFYSRPSYRDYQGNSTSRRALSGYIKIEYIKLMIYWVWHGVCPFYSN